jgi:hypothetical protein
LFRPAGSKQQLLLFEIFSARVAQTEIHDEARDARKTALQALQQHRAHEKYWSLAPVTNVKERSVRADGSFIAIDAHPCRVVFYHLIHDDLGRPPAASSIRLSRKPGTLKPAGWPPSAQFPDRVTRALERMKKTHAVLPASNRAARSFKMPAMS